RQAIAGQWAFAEFSALSRLYAAGVAVPYPVQVLGTELLLEFVGSAAGGAAPRLAGARPAPAELARPGGRLGPGAGAPAPAGPGPGRPGPRRPVRLQPAGARRPAGDDRPAPGGRRDRQHTGRHVPHPRRGERRPLVHGPRPGRGPPGTRRPARPAPPGGDARPL